MNNLCLTEVERFASPSASNESAERLKAARAARWSPALSSRINKINAPRIEDILFDNLVFAKVFLSQVSMHMSDKWRGSIQRQLDTLLNYDYWDEDSSTIENKSFLTFVRFIIFAKPVKLPSLGVSSKGNVLAAWRHGEQLVSVEFLADDMATAIISKPNERAPETVYWAGHVANLPDFAAGFGTAGCFFEG